ncbi:MAG: T9SS type A sorting domain-containing protein [Bacteroidia bacterium]|nr:T9SS type A sorting domain-containing protein [Bacteroidia bacterium]
MRHIVLGLLILGLAEAQTNCPYVRYIHINACGPGNQEGLNEYLLIWSGSGFNIDALHFPFPVKPGNTNLDCDNPTSWVCNSCQYGWTCPSGLISSLSSNACTGTTFTCISAGQQIPPNSWVMIFTGNAPTYIPNTSTLCGAGTVYVAVANQPNGQGRFLNNPSSSQNRRLRIAFDGMPACSMTVNYKNITQATDGDALIIDYSCVGKTEGANEANSPGCTASPYTPPSTSCFFSGNSSNGVTLHRPNDCKMPPLSVLPILWAYTHIEGSDLVWHATGLQGEEGAHLTLWYAPEPEGRWVEIAKGLPWIGRYRLTRGGFYRLSVPLRGGGVEYSPTVEYRKEGLASLYPNPAPGGPYLSFPEQVERVEVMDLQGRGVLSLSAPLTSEALRGLPPGLYLVRIYTHRGEQIQHIIVTEE